jgi:hypothetical protein
MPGALHDDSRMFYFCRLNKALPFPLQQWGGESATITLCVQYLSWHPSFEVIFVGFFRNKFFSLAQHPLGNQGILIIEASRSHSVWHTVFGRTPLDEGWVRRRDLCLKRHNTHNRYPCPVGIQTRNPSKRAGADLRLRTRGQWGRPEPKHRIPQVWSYQYLWLMVPKSTQ